MKTAKTKAAEPVSAAATWLVCQVAATRRLAMVSRHGSRQAALSSLADLRRLNTARRFFVLAAWE